MDASIARRLLGREQLAAGESTGTCGVMANHTKSITQTLPVPKVCGDTGIRTTDHTGRRLTARVLPHRLWWGQSLWIGQNVPPPVCNQCQWRRLAQFRMGSHMLGVETGRWQRLPRAQRLCQRCSCGVVDDEAHMVWECPAGSTRECSISSCFRTATSSQWRTLCSRMPGSWQPFCGFVMINVQSWRVLLPTGIKGFHPVSGECTVFGHDSLCMLLWVIPPEPEARPRWPTTSM